MTKKKMKASGKRKKGSRLERRVAKLIRLKGLDKNAGRQVLSGGDWAYRGDIRTKLPYHFELKCQEKVKIWQWWEKTKEQCPMNKSPVLVFSSNYRPILCVLEINDFLNLIRNGKTD